MNFKPRTFTQGKKVYYVRGKAFENSKDKRDGKEKAINYCLDNFYSPSEIKEFDSRLEFERYLYLYELQQCGKISNLEHHYLLKVQDSYVNANGETIPALTYEADFIYKDLVNEKNIVEDVKGSAYFIDERFLTLKQVFDYKFLPKRLYIKVVMKQNGEWVEWHYGEKKKSQKLIKKQREEIKKLKSEKKEQEKLARLKEREVARMKELLALPKLTSQQKKRLEELQNKYAQ